MTNDTRPPVAPVAPIERHYAMLRNGAVIGPMRKEYEDQDWFVSRVFDGYDWQSSGAFFVDGDPHGFDIIATISPAAMNEAVKLSAEKSVYGEIVFGLRSRLEALIPLASAACDYADQNCRAFPIATAPMEDVMLYDGNLEDAGWTQAYWCKNLMAFQSGGIKFDMSHMTHWAPLPPPPSNPPLPAVFVELGAALEKIKGA